MALDRERNYSTLLKNRRISKAKQAAKFEWATVLRPSLN
jgi:hypothetical protein